MLHRLLPCAVYLCSPPETCLIPPSQHQPISHDPLPPPSSRPDAMYMRPLIAGPRTHGLIEGSKGPVPPGKRLEEFRYHGVPRHNRRPFSLRRDIGREGQRIGVLWPCNIYRRRLTRHTRTPIRCRHDVVYTNTQRSTPSSLVQSRD